MPTDVELKLIANSAPAVKGIRDVITESQKLTDAEKKNQEATRNMYNELFKGSTKALGTVEKEEAILKRLQDWKKKASVEDHAMYNKEIEASKARLKAYEDTTGAIDKNKKSGDNLLSSVGGWVKGFVTITAAVTVFKEIIASTDTLSDKFAATLGGWKEGFAAMARAIANKDFKDFFKNIRDAVEEGQRFVMEQDKIEDTEIAMKIKIAEAETKIQALRYSSVTSKDREKAKADGLEAERLTKEAAKMRVDLADMVYNNDITHAASIAGYRDKELEQGKELVKQYLLQDEEIKKQIALGWEYDRLLTERANLKLGVNTSAMSPKQAADAIEQNKKERDSVEEKIKAFGAEGEAYRKLAIGMGNLTGEFRLKIAADKEAIEQANQSQFNLRLGAKNAALDTKDMKKETDSQLKIQEDYQKASQDLIDKFAKSNIDSLEGKSKLVAIREFGIKEVNEIKDKLEKAAKLAGIPITSDQLVNLQTMADNVWKAYYEALAKGAEKGEFKLSKKDKDAISKALLGGYEVTERDQEDFVTKIKGGVKKLLGLQKTTITKEQQEQIRVAGKTKQIFSVWELMGIDPESEDGKKFVESIQQAAETTQQIMDQAYQQRIDDATRIREIDEGKLADAEQSLNQEIELYKAGYASNVAEKQKEVADLKKKRDQDLKNEQEAVNKKKTLDAIQQTTSLITASANILKSLSGAGPLGIAAGIIAIAAMFAAFAAARVQAAKATKLESGGYGDETGVITGRSHSRGGERFLDHVEVEEGERWGVLSRQASRKYGPVFNNMVESFNRDDKHLMYNTFKVNPDIIPSINNITIDNSGPNNRLDKIHSKLSQLNNTMQPKVIEDKIELESKTIIHKGTNTRIISR